MLLKNLDLNLINQILHDIIGKLHGARLASEIGHTDLTELALCEALNISVLYRSIINLSIDFSILEKIKKEKNINFDLKILKNANEENQIPLFAIIGILLITNSQEIEIIDEKNINAVISFADNPIWQWIQTKYKTVIYNKSIKILEKI